MSNDEKYQLVMDAAKAVEDMATRIVKMAQAYQAFIRGGGDEESEAASLRWALVVLNPYLLTLFDSEEGLGDPGKDREAIYKTVGRVRDALAK